MIMEIRKCSHRLRTACPSIVLNLLLSRYGNITVPFALRENKVVSYSTTNLGGTAETVRFRPYENRDGNAFFWCKERND